MLGWNDHSNLVYVNGGGGGMSAGHCMKDNNSANRRGKHTNSAHGYEVLAV